MREQTSMNN